MATLYELTGEYKSLLEAIEAGEIPEEAIKDTLDAVGGEWEAKIENCISAIKNKEMLIAGIKEQAKAMQERAKTYQEQVDRLKEYIKENMETVGQDKYESVNHKASFRKSDAVVIDNESEYIEYASKNAPQTLKEKVEITINKSEVKKLLQDGYLREYAHIETRKNLQIK